MRIFSEILSVEHRWYGATVLYRTGTTYRHIHVHYHIFHKIQIFQTLYPCESLAIQTRTVRDGGSTTEKKRCNNGRIAREQLFLLYIHCHLYGRIIFESIREIVAILFLRNECEAESV